MAAGLHVAAIIASAALCLAAAACFALQSDGMAGLTNWPPWFWAVAGLALLIPVVRWHRRIALVVALLWLIYLFVFAEEIRSLVRRPRLPTTAFETERQAGRALRVMSVNCVGGDPAAAAEVIPYTPDIVLLQESPSLESLLALARELYGEQGSILRGHDAAVIARGTMASLGKMPHSLAAAYVHLASGLEVNVISAHLLPPVFGSGPWSRGYWTDRADNRRARREQVEGIASLIGRLPSTVPLIIGGDFNCPAGDGALAPLRGQLRDTFAQGGVGWGNTVLNEFPLMRFDQIWCSSQFRVSQVRAIRSQTSDHRMVMADLILSEER